jgi:hypothetical protein
MNALGSWVDRVPRDVLEVARALHLGTMPQRGASGGAFSPCPACGAERRHQSRRDARLACGVRADGAGWRCYGCDASGDAIDLVACVLEGRRFRELERAGRERVREWFDGPTPAPTPRAVERPATSPERAAPTYPPAEQVRAVWAACVPAIEDREVAAYLERRGVDPVVVADRDLARALPADASGPPWARLRGLPWASSGHRLIAPLVDSRGRLSSLLARRIAESDTPKSVAPSGHTRAALVLACALARLVLEHGARPMWWASQAPRLRLVIAEGEVDYLAAATRAPDSEHAPATLGIFSGSWTPEIAARVPDGAELVIATDADEAGDRYAAQIVGSMAARRAVALSRWSPS